MITLPLMLLTLQHPCDIPVPPVCSIVRSRLPGLHLQQRAEAVDEGVFGSQLNPMLLTGCCLILAMLTGCLLESRQAPIRTIVVLSWLQLYNYSHIGVSILVDYLQSLQFRRLLQNS